MYELAISIFLFSIDKRLWSDFIYRNNSLRSYKAGCCYLNQMPWKPIMQISSLYLTNVGTEPCNFRCDMFRNFIFQKREFSIFCLARPFRTRYDYESAWSSEDMSVFFLFLSHIHFWVSNKSIFSLKLKVKRKEISLVSWCQNFIPIALSWCNR